MPSLEWEKEWVQAGQIFTPTGETVASNYEWFLELSIELGGKFCVDELGKWLRV
jgi:hypothetical protein